MDLKIFKELLEQKKQEIQSHSKELLQTTLHSERAADDLDVATNDSNAALAKRLLERQNSYLKRIDRTLKKINDGTYGECEGCGEMISEKRLLARPIAVLCILCKEKQEKNEKRSETPRGILSLEWD